MRRIVCLVTSACLFLWILPLGIFIKPSQEKTACGGKRAFHMCSMTQNSEASTRSQDDRVSIASSSGVQKAQTSQNAGGGNDWIALTALLDSADPAARYRCVNFIPRSLFRFSPSEPVPKF